MKFKAELDQLNAVIGFVEETLEGFDVGMKETYALTVSIEELFTNVAKFAYPNSSGDYELEITKVDDKVILVQKDSGIPFDPLAQDDPDTTLAAEDRAIGGLGILMVKKMNDEVKYEYKDNMNILTLVKKVG